jgi:hypothetical protein
MPIGEPLADPSALSEPDRSDRISGINTEVTNQCGKGHTTTSGLNVVRDRPFLAVSHTQAESANRRLDLPPDGSRRTLTETSSPGTAAVQAYRQDPDGGRGATVAPSPFAAPQQSYAITKKVVG